MASHEFNKISHNPEEQLLKNENKLERGEAHDDYAQTNKSCCATFWSCIISLLCVIWCWIRCKCCKRKEMAYPLKESRFNKELSVLCQITATIYNPGQLPVVENMLPEFTSKLERLLRSRHGVELTIDYIYEPSGPAASQPLLVMCVNASRLGTDVDNALQHVTCTQESMVVVLHYKDKHALPSQSSDKLLIGPSYQALGGISDIAFTSENGLYNCEMNERGIKKIADFIIQRN